MFFLIKRGTAEISPLSLPSPLPTSSFSYPPAGGAFPITPWLWAYWPVRNVARDGQQSGNDAKLFVNVVQDRKSTRLNSSHANISYAVFCLKKNRIHPQQNAPLRMLF